jgi:HlyD family secretion protein
MMGLAALVIALAWLVFATDSEPRLAIDPERLMIAEVTDSTFQEYIAISGTVEPIQTVFLDVTEGGRVERVLREAGTLVRAGDTILILSNADLLLSMTSREAQLFEQRNNLRATRLMMQRNALDLEAELLDFELQRSRARREHKQNTVLFERGLIAIEEFNESQEQIDYLDRRCNLARRTRLQDSVFRSAQIILLESAVDRIQSNLELVQNSLDQLKIRAPVTGQLTSLTAEVGQSIARGARVGRIDVLDGFKIRAEVDEYYLSRVGVGQEGYFTFDGQDQRVIVTKVYPEVLDGRFTVDFELPDGTISDIRRGQSLRVRLQMGGAENCLTVAKGGFYESTGGHWVYVLDPSGEFAVKRSVRFGRQNPQVIEILEGLSPGDKIITSAYDAFDEAERLILNQ